MVDEPTATDQNGSLMYYGSVVACPVVSNTFKEALPYLGYYPEYSDDELAELGVTVPDFTGQTIESVKLTLESLDLTYDVVGEGETVVTQMPPRAETLLHGGTVVLYSEKVDTPEYTKVPNILNMSLSEANETLTNAGLNFMTSGGAASNDGAVAYTQNYEEGYIAPIGTIVEVVFIVKDQG